MFDSDDPQVLKDPMFNNQRVATYADLLTPELVAYFGSRLAVIDRGHGDPLNRAHIVDVETGALSIPEGAAKMKTWAAEGRQFVTGYVNRGNRDELSAEVGAIKHSLWVATLDGTMDVGDSYTAMVQFAGEAAIGKHVDVSILFHDWWLPVGKVITTTDAEALMTAVAGLTSAVAKVNSAAAVI